MASSNALPQPLIESIAGLLAGAVSTLVAHPLDLVKTRLQVDQQSPSRLGSSSRVVQAILHNEGGIGGFYRGIGPNLIGNSVSWSLYFLWYGQIKARLYNYHGSNVGLTYYDYFAASGAAGALTAISTNPIWVIKTRMLSTSSKHPGAYTSVLDGTRQIYRSEGIPGFYRGLIPSLFGVSHGALQFMAYEQLKRQMSPTTPRKEDHPNSYGTLLTSGLSKIFAGSVTYPYQVIRARMQTYDAGRQYPSVRFALWTVWKQEGIGGFYKGLGPNLLRVLPSTWVTFLVYEKTRYYLPQIMEQRG